VRFLNRRWFNLYVPENAKLALLFRCAAFATAQDLVKARIRFRSPPLVVLANAKRMKLSFCPPCADAKNKPTLRQIFDCG
jgi:hypothetical protein